MSAILYAIMTSFNDINFATNQFPDPQNIIADKAILCLLQAKIL